MLTLTLLDIGLDIMRFLVLLVDDSILGSRGTAGQAGVAVFSNALVGVHGGLSSSALGGLRDVVRRYEV